jgi:putative glutamine amidotransferase
VDRERIEKGKRGKEREEMNQPFIGIPTEAVHDKDWWPPAHGHRETYIRAIVNAGGIPLLIPLVEQEEVLQSYYERLDGLLLAGGRDIAPVHYGEEPHPELGEVDPLQDHIELSLTRRALNDGKPLLAICRGLQVLNVARGGTLYQDIPSQHETPLDHKASSKHAIATRSSQWQLLSHEMRLETNSRLATLLSTTILNVNTSHHQAIKQLAHGLQAVGWSSDDLIEAVEGTDHPFLIGVQCHPEEICTDIDTRWQTVFAALVNATFEH